MSTNRCRDFQICISLPLSYIFSDNLDLFLLLLFVCLFVGLSVFFLLSLSLFLATKRDFLNIYNICKYTFFYNQPIYNELTFQWQVAKQLSGLGPFTKQH